MPESFQEFRQRQAKWYKEEFGLIPLQWGAQRAKIVIIGQAPSRQGQKNGRPFSDKTGERMREVWFKVSDEIFYDPDKFYLTALGLVFPGKDRHGGDKRPASSVPRRWMAKELEFLSPKLFVVLGRMASEFLFPKRKFEDLIFNDQVLLGRKAFVLPHPSPLNIKWYKDHPKFLTERLLVVRREIHKSLK